MIGREDDLERLNRMALKMAREVADASGKLMAGGLCGTLEYKADDPKSIEWVRSMFKASDDSSVLAYLKPSRGYKNGEQSLSSADISHENYNINSKTKKRRKW